MVRAIASIRKRGILVEHGSETRTVAADAAYIGTSLPAADLILVLVKSWQTASIAGYLEGYLAPEGIILSLQNGLGNIELLGPKACPGVTATGATLVGPGYVRTGEPGRPIWWRLNRWRNSSGVRASNAIAASLTKPKASYGAN